MLPSGPYCGLMFLALEKSGRVLIVPLAMSIVILGVAGVGYAVVQQDLRGRYRSEGTGQYRHTANPHEGMDGYDTIEWIAAQPWSNGRWRGRSIQTTTSIWMACSLRTLPHPRRQRSGSPLTQRILFPPWVAR